MSHSRDSVVVNEAAGSARIGHATGWYDVILAKNGRTLFYQEDELVFHVIGHVPAEALHAMVDAYVAGHRVGEGIGFRTAQANMRKAMGAD